uniref:Uncharacterized protein n=1 Tax=Strongyloides papillosus TaxID=174720 RepID=A0A0N5CB45_STREA
MRKFGKSARKFLTEIPAKKEDRILYYNIILLIISFVVVRILMIFFLVQIHKSSCSTVICPDMEKIAFSKLPLTIKILELVRPFGVTLSFVVIAIIFLLINVENENSKLITFIGIGVASMKLLTTIIEMGSNLDTLKYVTTKSNIVLIYFNIFFVCSESFLSYGSILAAFYRYKLQMYDHLSVENTKSKSKSRERSKSRSKD